MINTHAKYAPSSSSVWLNCPSSVELKTIDKKTVFAETGTAKHLALSNALKGLVDISTLEEDTLEAYNFINGLINKESKVYIENKFIYNEDFFGTPDVVIINNKQCHIIDFKSGVQVNQESFASQLLCYATLVFNEIKDIESFKLTILQPNALNSFFSENEIGIFNVNYVKGFLNEIINIFKSSQLVEGEHCLSCKAIGSCPLKEKNINKIIKDNIVEVKKDFKEIVKELSNESIKALLKKEKEVSKFFEALNDIGLEKARAGVDGFILDKTAGRRAWGQEEQETIANINSLGIDTQEVMEVSLMSPTQIEKKDKGLYKKIESLVIKKEGNDKLKIK